ncbi:MAG: ParB N-terminal domain-containing protein [Opitutaceae bacterium]
MNNYYKHSIKPLREIIPNDNNARTHSEKQLQQIMAAIQAFGFTNPLLVSVGGEIIAGHGRYEAAKRLGFDDVPCIIVDGLTRSQQRALMLADNRLALNAGWDNAMLSKELTALNFDGFDIEALGFTSAEIADLVVPISSGKDPDATPPTSKDPRTLKGDIYELGDHLLICGDSTTPESYGRLLLSDKADCVWTDPPYNVNYGDKATFLNRRGKGNRIQKKILNDHMGASAFR